MDIRRIIKEMNNAGVPEELVHIGNMPNYDDRYNLIRRQDGKWEVFYGKQGCKSDLHVYETEEEAVDCFLERIKKHASEQASFLPVGSVVRLTGGKVNLVIVARAIHAKAKNEQLVYYDYGAFPYPHGLVDGNMAYFQKDAIEEVLFVGYINEQEKQMVQHLLKFNEANKNMPRGNKDSL